MELLRQILQIHDPGSEHELQASWPYWPDQLWLKYHRPGMSLCPHIGFLITDRLFQYYQNVFHIDREDVMRHEEAEKRLKTVEGHVAGIRRMLEQEAYCIDVIRQIQAVQAALNKVGKIVLDEHLHSCVITAVQGEDPSERERVLQEIIDVYETSNKL